MKRVMLAAMALAGALATVPLDAQQRWSLELRAAGALPTGEIAGEELKVGAGFEGSVRYHLLPHLAAYAGWDWMSFGSDESFAGPDVDFEETGYALGLRFEHPFRGEAGGPAWWARAGATLNHLELEDPDGEPLADSDHGPGWEAGVGVALPVGDGWSITPGARWRALSRDVEIDGQTTDVDLRYVTLGLGVVRVF